MNNETYQKLDRSALWLLLGEFGGAALLLVLLILIFVGNLISYGAFDWDYSTGEIITLIIALVYGLAYLGNLVIGVIGLYLYVTEKRDGYPGTGHMLNWTLLSATLAIVLVLIVAVLSSM
ncbi:MAG: hypothetical protein HFACDABA_01084 [Anaerolineales bacterium]|nr:hypothetical protein [Anaerolineales bacterium]